MSFTEKSGVSLDELKNAVDRAIVTLCNQDAYLLTIDGHEQALTHRLAVYLERDPVFKNWDVDCEYNRHGERKKTMETLNGAEVRPDIVIHERGHDGNNLLAIEAKKRGAPREGDRRKILGYLSQYQYRFGLCLSFNVGKVTTEWFSE